MAKSVIDLFIEAPWIAVLITAVGAILAFRSRRQEGRPPAPAVSRAAALVVSVLGFGLLTFILLQESTIWFAKSPAASLSLLIGLGVVAAVILRFGRKAKPPSAFLAWLPRYLAPAVIVIAVLLPARYFSAPQKYARIRAALEEIAATEGQLAPDFSFAIVATGERKHISDYKGNVVLVNFWATWCVPCVKEMPYFTRLDDTYKGRGLILVNLSPETRDKIAAYLAKKPMPTVHAYLDGATMPDFYRFGKTFPMTYVIDRQGVVRAALSGAQDYATFDRLVRRCL